MSADIRNEFCNFVGLERFQRFVKQVAIDSTVNPRLRYWQETCWKQFSELASDAPSTVDAIYQIFLYCYVHDRELQRSDEVLLFPEVRRSPELKIAMKNEIPFSFGRQLCSQCIDDSKQWIRTHDTSILRRRTTWTNYLKEHAHDESPRFARLRALVDGSIKNEMQEGDELWEYDAGLGATGLAILRNGIRIKAWSAPIHTC